MTRRCKGEGEKIYKKSGIFQIGERGRSHQSFFHLAEALQRGRWDDGGKVRVQEGGKEEEEEEGKFEKKVEEEEKEEEKANSQKELSG